MSDQTGRRWLWLELSQMHIFETINFFGEDAERKTYYAGGERNVGLRLLATIMRVAPREYVLAMEENTKLEKDSGGSSNDPNGNTYGDTPGSTDPGVDGS
jgi:hypothetical protein